MSTVTAYVRVSTDRQTLENQRSEISRYASSHGLVIDHWIEEVVSGKRTILEKKVILYSVKENCCLGDNINSKVILFAFGLAAEIERDLISMRTKEALAARKEQGMALGRRPGDSPKIRMLQEHGDEILRDYASGMSVSCLSKKFNVSRDTMTKYLKMSQQEK